MKILINSSKDIHNSPIMCSSFNKMAEYMNKFPCMFITAFKSYDVEGNPITVSENRRRNKQLAQDIHNSDLTYIKCHGGFLENNPATDTRERVTEESFCVVNNGYRTEDFVKLAVSWCKKYNQDAVLVTFPHRDKTRNYYLNVIGKYYDQSGNATYRFDHATIQDVEEYFSKMLAAGKAEEYGTGYTNTKHKDWELEGGKTISEEGYIPDADADGEIITTTLVPFSNTAGYVMAADRFKQKYPEL